MEQGFFKRDSRFEGRQPDFCNESLRIDDTLKLDYGSLTKIDDPLTKILNE